MREARRQAAFEARVAAAKLAHDRAHPSHQANGDEQRYASANYAMSFTKGLTHDNETGLIAQAEDFRAFRTAIDEGFVDPFTLSVPASIHKQRAWEAPTAGVVFDLEGPDAQAVTMPPAPALGSKELAYEIAEVYELALLRDVPLTALKENATDPNVVDALSRLNNIDYDLSGRDGRPRKSNACGKLDAQTLFRGSSPSVEKGPYLSQFLLIGNDLPSGESVADGYIGFGALRVDQRVPVAVAQNYMIVPDEWLNVQNGANVRCNATLFGKNPARRFISTPRDMATYVHDDALYEAYLNACLILLGMGAPTDPAFDKLSGAGTLFLDSINFPKDLAQERHQRQAGGFALYGGPHILTLVTEVATRALKAVRYQKFNTHCRLRPEALAARIEKKAAIETKFPVVGSRFSQLENAISATVAAVRQANGKAGSATAFLPMAFQEGSPMHPSYGAGHAAVAGACVTMLKAFFDTDAVFVRRAVTDDCGKKTSASKKSVKTRDVFARYQAGDEPVYYEPNATGNQLLAKMDGEFLTLEGELNKLAANIAIARNMAGVHYFSDYYDSLRLGEAVALGMLEEQALSYPTDPFVLSVPTFDGAVVRIGAR